LIELFAILFQVIVPFCIFAPSIFVIVEPSQIYLAAVIFHIALTLPFTSSSKLGVVSFIPILVQVSVIIPGAKAFPFHFGTLLFSPVQRFRRAAIKTFFIALTPALVSNIFAIISQTKPF